MRRWVIFLDQWEQALATGKEVLVLGDCNLDLFKFDRAGVLQPLVDSMMQRIYPHGVVQCVQGPTHSWPGQVPSGIDHVYTSNPDKLSQVQVKVCGSSDHRLILATRYAKNIRQGIRYCKQCSYKILMRKYTWKKLPRSAGGMYTPVRMWTWLWTSSLPSLQISWTKWLQNGSVRLPR